MENMSRLDVIKNNLQLNIGREVKVMFGRGKRHKTTEKGIIENVYPSIFVIKLSDNAKKDKMSVSYADILTKTVKLSLVKKEG